MRNPLANRIQKAEPFSRKWFLGGINNLFWVFIITVMIWVYADMEFTDSIKLKIRLKLTAGQQTEYRLLSDQTANIEVEIAGSKSSLDRFRRELERKGNTLELDVTRFGAGDRNMPARELLTAAANLQDRGISIKELAPQTIHVNLEALEKIDNVRVELAISGGALTSPPKPKEISILVPASYKKRIQLMVNQHQLYLQTQLVNVSTLAAGKNQPVTAAVSKSISIDGKNIQIEPVPAEVTFLVDVKSRIAQKKLSIAVELLTPASWSDPKDKTWENYKLARENLADWRPEITVSGPENIVSNPAELTKKIRAFIKLDDNDKKSIGSWTTRKVRIVFEEGSKLKLISAAPVVKFRLEKITPKPGE